jgi:hypothetical protein
MAGAGPIQIPHMWLKCHQNAFNAPKMPSMEGKRAMANRSPNFRLHDVRRALRAARAEGLTNPSVRIRTPGGAEYFIGGEVTAPKKHSRQAVAPPPATRRSGPSRRGG